MTHAMRDSFLDLERHRQLLDNNIEKLQKSLRHWQTWEAEYEGLKEELSSAGPNINRQQLVSLAEGYEGELVTKKEVNEIIGVAAQRNFEQIINLVDRRMDYVSKNIKTFEKQIEVAENRLAAATVISTPEVRNEEGLPLTEIVEELDDEDNVIASHISTPGSARSQLLEVLQKAGVAEPDLVSPPEHFEATPTLENKPHSVKNEEPKILKKTVKFSEDTKADSEFQKSAAAKRVEEIMEDAREQEKVSKKPAIIPTNESPEDAKLRREMLQYGMDNVGAIVAELDIEEGSEWSDEDIENEDLSESDAEEDRFGRSTSRVVDDDLRQRMVELEERLGVRMMQNVGKAPDEFDVMQEGIGRISIKNQVDSSMSSASLIQTDVNQPEPPNNLAATSPLKKSVRFSEKLDVSSSSQRVLAPTSTTVESPKPTAPVTDIVERATPVQFPTSEVPGKTSRFRSTRVNPPNVLNGPLAADRISGSVASFRLEPASAPKPFSSPIQFIPAEDSTRPVPTGPEGRTLASTVVEREVALGTAIEPDELDSRLLNQEVATEYHKMRNRMINREGGFMKEDTREKVPISEAEGGPRKVSKFKAARLSKS